MIKILKKIHFYIVAASIGLLTVAVLLPRSNEQVAQDQVLLLQKVFDGQGSSVLDLINETALLSAGVDTNKYFDEAAQVSAMFSMVDLGGDSPDFDPSELIKFFKATGTYEIDFETAANDYIGPNKPEFDTWDSRVTQAEKVIDIIDFPSFAGGRTVNISFSSNLWIPALGSKRVNGCIDDALAGPLASMGQRMEGPLRFVLDQEHMTLEEVKEWWNVAQSLRIFSFHDMLPTELSYEVFSDGASIGSAKLRLVEGSLRKGSNERAETNADQEPLFVRLCVKEHRSYFTNDVSTAETPMLAVLSPIEVKEVSIVPKLLGDNASLVPNEPFEKAFSTLNQYSETFSDLTLPQLERIFSTLVAKTQSSIDIAGIKIATNNIKLVGAAGILALLIYFSAHLRNATLTSASSNSDETVWIAMYDDLPSKSISFTSLILLPVGTIVAILAISASDYQYSRFEYAFTDPLTWIDAGEILVLLFFALVSVGVGLTILRSLGEVRKLQNYAKVS